MPKWLLACPYRKCNQLYKPVYFSLLFFLQPHYGLNSIHTNETLDFLNEVQGRLIKAWFGVLRYCSTSSLRAAIGWRKASEFHLSTSTEPKCILDPLLPIPIHMPAHSRRNMGLWYSNGLHHLWCCTPSCYTINQCSAQVFKRAGCHLKRAL